MSVARLLQGLESRRLMSIAAADTSFGKGGMVTMYAEGGGLIMPLGITALADGRVVVENAAEIRYLKGDGNLDKSRGVDGRLVTDFHGGGVTVNPLNGAVAQTIHRAIGDGEARVELYDPAGKLTRRVDVPLGYREFARDVLFRPDGGLLLITTQEVYTDPQHSSDFDLHLIVRAFDANIDPITSYGTNGKIDVLISEDVGFEHLRDASIDQSLIDTAGRLIVPYVTQTSPSGSTAPTRADRLLRITANGALDTSFDGDGLLKIYSYGGSTSATKTTTEIVDRVLDRASNAVYILRHIASSSDSDPTKNVLRIDRIATNGTITSTTIDSAYDGRLTVASDGNVYVATTGLSGAETKGRGGARVYRFSVDSAGKFKAAEGWSPTGDSPQTTINLEPYGIAVGKDGRVYLTGDGLSGADSDNTRPNGSGLVYAFNGRTSFADVHEGEVVLRADGTLVIKGGAKTDTISVNSFETGVEVVINKGRAKLFNAAKIRGVVIQTGKGDDKVDTKLLKMAAYVEGGAGNDTLLGGLYSDTLLGNAGNDQLEGRSRNDRLEGNDGNDLILAGDGADCVIGGAGNDTIFASGFARDDFGSDEQIDSLFGGDGKDYVRRDRDPSRRGDILFSDKSDTIVR